MQSTIKHQFILIVAVAILLAGTIALYWFQPVDAAKSASNGHDPVLILLDASWCATCREIDPIVERIVSGSPGLQLVRLDVDESSAPAEAGRYGITLSGNDVPEVYLFNNGRAVLLFDGKGYHFGHPNQAEAQIRQRLTQNLAR